MLFAALPVGVLVVLGFFVDLLEIWPILLVLLGVASCGCAVVLGIRERSLAFWRAWGKKVREGKAPGEATERILGSPDPRFDNARPGRHLKPAKESKAKGLYFRIP